MAGRGIASGAAAHLSVEKLRRGMSGSAAPGTSAPMAEAVSEGGPSASLRPLCNRVVLCGAAFHVGVRAPGVPGTAAPDASAQPVDPGGAVCSRLSTYVATTGSVDDFAEALYSLMLFNLTVLVGRLRRLALCCPFRVSWWAVSFPLAASASASVRYASARSGPVTDAVAWVLLALASLVIVWLAGRTLLGIGRGELRRLSS